MKLTPYNVTEEAAFLVKTLLEADPLSFDPDAEITRLTTYTCPECNSTNTSQPDEEGLVDCMNCGIWFKWPDEAKGVHAVRYRESIEEGEDPETPEEFQHYVDQHGAGPPRKRITHIETKSDYKEYQLRVKEFFQHEGINCLTEINPEAEGSFSWRFCDCCHRALGGTRRECSGYNPTTHEVQGPYDICDDCRYYVEYGQLDDQTMMDLKDD